MEKSRQTAVEDDYRVGLIAAYLKDKSAVCTLELWQEALKNGIYTNPSRRDSIEIGQIMGMMEEWEREKYPAKYGKYGSQRGWRRLKTKEKDFDEIAT